MTTAISNTFRSAACILVAALFSGASLYAQVPTPTQGRAELTHALDTEAMRYTATRRAEVAHITTRAAAIQRQHLVREKILHLIGGLPERTPLNAKIMGSTQFDGFRIEKILFESQPNYLVTALLYLPEGSQTKHAGIVMAPGHGPNGKASDARTAATFARNGFVVLSYDPIGQGERLQYPNPKDPAKSLANRPTGEHGEAGLQPVLIGDAPARYAAWDGIRAIDYLSQRTEVDAARIGAFGCSGGGTITALTAALDPRVAATAVACYNTSFDTLLPSIGPQDAEQSTPGLIAAGLDFPDWIELVAPRPYAAVATYSDMFPFAGARATVTEARRFYSLFDPAAAGTPTGNAAPTATPTEPALNIDTANSVALTAPLQFITGPGGHGALSPILGNIVGFFLRNLQPGVDASRIVLPSASKPGAPAEIPAQALQVTPTGQVLTSFPSTETVWSLNRKRTEHLLAASHHATQRASLIAQVRAATGSVAQPGASHPATLLLQAPSGEITLPVGDGTNLRGRIAIPPSAGVHPAVLLLVPDSIDGANEIAQKNRRRFEELAHEGNIVLAVTPRPSFPCTDDMKSPILGPFYLLSLRAELLGHTLPGLRTDDVIRTVDYLAARKDVDSKHITAEGRGHMGTVLVHAALLDHRLHHVMVQGGLSSYAGLVEAKMPIGAPEESVPGVLRHYDLPDLRAALDKRLTFIDPVKGDDDLSRESTPLPTLH